MTELRRDHCPRRLIPVRPPNYVLRTALGTVAGLRVVAVDGRAVRDRIDVDFTMGGNGARYSYCPPGELWVDDTMGPVDTCATIVHEAVEFFAMRDDRLSYETAHELASAEEITLRHHFLFRRAEAPTTNAEAVRVAARVLKALE